MASDRSREPPAVERSLPAGSMVTPNRSHLAGPVDVVGQLSAAAEGRDVAAVAAPGRPRHQVGAALVVHALAVPAGDDGGADAAAVLADHEERVPIVGMSDVRHADVDLADRRGGVERGADVSVHGAGPVDLAHPVVGVGPDAEAVEGVDEDLREVARVRRVAVAGRIRDVRKRHAHGALDGVRRQERLGVHRIEVVDPVAQLDRHARRRGGRGRWCRPPPGHAGCRRGRCRRESSSR